MTSDCSLVEFYQVSSENVESYIKSIANGKAIFDVIPFKILKSILPTILEP